MSGQVDNIGGSCFRRVGWRCGHRVLFSHSSWLWCRRIGSRWFVLSRRNECYSSFDVFFGKLKSFVTIDQRSDINLNTSSSRSWTWKKHPKISGRTAKSHVFKIRKPTLRAVLILGGTQELSRGPSMVKFWILHCTYVCMYVYICLYVHTRTRTLYIYISIYIYVCIHIFIYIYIHTYILSFPRKNADRLKKDRTRPDRWARRCTATVFYPNRRTSSVLHREGRPSAATSHESRPGKPSFLHPWSSPRGSPRPAEEQITRKTGLGKPLGLYPNTSTRCYTTTWRRNDPARSQPRR